jgi:hypothetical protein
MSNSPSSMAQLTNLPDKSGFCIIFLKGCSVNTLMVCTWMYGLTLRADVTKAKDSFLIRGYCSSAPCRALFVK